MKKMNDFKKLKIRQGSQSGKMEKTIFGSNRSKVLAGFSQYRDNLGWTSTKREELRSKYGDKYIAIHNSKVCIAEDNLAELLRKIDKKYSNPKEVVIDFVGKKKISLLL